MLLPTERCGHYPVTMSVPNSSNFVFPSWYSRHVRDEDAAVGDCHGHITSLAVARSHRKLGIATRLMEATRKQALIQFRPGQQVVEHALTLSGPVCSPLRQPQIKQWPRSLARNTSPFMSGSPTEWHTTSTQRRYNTSELRRLLNFSHGK